MLSRVTNKYRRLPSTSLNAQPLQQLNTPQGQVHLHLHNENASGHIPAAQCNPLAGLCLSTACISPQFGLLHSPPSHRCSCRHISIMTSFTEVISLKQGICIVLWAEDLCQQDKQEIFFFGQLGRLLLLGIARTDFKPGFILILVKSLHPSRAFLSRLTCLLLTIG